MEKHTGYGFRGALLVFLRGLSPVIVFLWMLPIGALILWSAFAGKSTVSEQLILICFALSFGWANISMLKWVQGCVGWEGSASRLLFGPRPEDEDELAVWRRGRQLRYSFLAMVLFMGAFAILKWVQSDY